MKTLEDLVEMYDEFQGVILESKKKKFFINKKTYRQLILGLLAEHLSPELSSKMATEIIEFGEEHNLLNK